MIDIILFMGFWYLFLDTVSNPLPAKRVVNVSQTCHKRVETCRKRVFTKRRPFLPHEVMRRIRD